VRNGSAISRVKDAGRNRPGGPTEDPMRSNIPIDLDQKPKIWRGPGARTAALFRDGTFTVTDEVFAITADGKRYGWLQYKFGTSVIDVAFSTGEPNKILVADGQNLVHLIDQSCGTRTVVYEASSAIDKIEFTGNDTQGTIKTKDGQTHTFALP
jgi:hypothetical protein